MRGVGINQATEKIEIDRYSNASNGVTTAHVDTTLAFSGDYASIPAKGWMRYADVDFSCLYDGYLMIRAKASGDTEWSGWWHDDAFPSRHAQPVAYPDRYFGLCAKGGC